ncbi:winged helix-turn-helix domain-containing protein [Oscillatoria laete-virens NRMC-F 0139]|nr:winged helix-turn-helix domain-containing protein [Oscillatoria laete-virens]MDL5052649.1 winged helix-turn-helix domain-containing protein [Oscillatoria laete-virens NRMC-F 0139]
MPKKAHLANHYSSEELKQKYLKSQVPVESRRWHLLWKISLGWTIKKSAIAVGVNYDYAKQIVKRYNDLGAEGLTNRKNQQRQQRGGKKALLTDEQLEKLRQELASKPSDGGVWTGPKVARWIEQETQVEKVWHQRGWDYLKKLKYSWQSPRPKHRKSCQIEQEQFLHNLPLKVKSLEGQYPDAKIELWFLMNIEWG